MLNQEQTKPKVTAFDIFLQFNQAHNAKYVVMFGLIFFAGLWMFIYLNLGKAVQIFKIIPDKLLFIGLFIFGVVFVKAVINLLPNKSQIEVGDKGMMSGYAYKSASDNKFRNWIIAAMLSAGHAILFLLMRW